MITTTHAAIARGESAPIVRDTKLHIGAFPDADMAFETGFEDAREGINAAWALVIATRYWPLESADYMDGYNLWLEIHRLSEHTGD